MLFKVKKPIPGFEHLDKVILRKIDDSFSILENENGEVIFILINPFLLKKEFDFEVPADIRVLLDLKEGSKTYIFTNVIKKNPTNESLINFKAPFIFNLDNFTCAQVILEDEGIYPLKEFVAS